MIVAEREGYGFVPLIVGGLITAGAAAAGYFLGRRGQTAKYYSCLEYQVKKGVPPDEARRICAEPLRKLGIIDYLILVPTLLGVGFMIYKAVRQGVKK